MDAVQYHPTTFYDERNKNQPQFLISEAVRGDGAILLNEKGERFMQYKHPLKELAPRDIVSNIIHTEIIKQKKPCVYLDITHKRKEEIVKRFPTIYNHCMERNIDMSKDLVPVHPVAHYFMGGIEVGVNGKTSIQNLYACGECACTGVHGENRLASNSLLEAIVFGRKIAQYIDQMLQRQYEEADIDTIIVEEEKVLSIPEEMDTIILTKMINYCGVVKERSKLNDWHNILRNMVGEYRKGIFIKREEIERYNKILIAYIITDYALKNRIKVS
jgi:L-aspartate oxidase